MRFFRIVFEDFGALIRRLREVAKNERFRRADFKYFDKFLFGLVVVMTLFGAVAIFSAATMGVTETKTTIMQALEGQDLTYPRQHLIWLLLGVASAAVICILPYRVYEEYWVGLYLLNIGMLVITLAVAEVGRGGMTAYVSVGSSGRNIQLSELGKVIMVISLAAVFSRRTRPIKTWTEIFLMLCFVGLPVVLVALQPDVGTAMVYLAIFAALTFVSGTDGALIWKIIILAVIGLGTLFFALSNTSSGENFRFMRILIWLDPYSYPDEARQVINGQIAVGSGGLTGKGVISPGSFGSLGYISDDHTDFIFSIVCESFGFVGAALLILAYIALIGRLIYHAIRIKDPMGSYIIMGVAAMFLFHIVENIGMVIGLLPVTGIPLPFISYGGSNMLTNYLAIGLVENVIVRSRKYDKQKAVTQSRQAEQL